MPSSSRSSPAGSPHRRRGCFAEGLLRRMFAASTRIPAMYGMIRALRGAGPDRAGPTPGDATSTRARTSRPLRRRGLLRRVRHAQAGEAIFLHTAKSLGLEPTMRHRRYRGERGRGRRVRHHRRAPHRGGSRWWRCGTCSAAAKGRPVAGTGPVSGAGPVAGTGSVDGTIQTRQHDAITQGPRESGGLACQAWWTIRIPPARAGRRHEGERADGHQSGTGAATCPARLVTAIARTPARPEAAAGSGPTSRSPPGGGRLRGRLFWHACPEHGSSPGRTSGTGVRSWSGMSKGTGSTTRL